MELPFHNMVTASFQVSPLETPLAMRTQSAGPTPFSPVLLGSLVNHDVYENVLDNSGPAIQTNEFI